VRLRRRAARHVTRNDAESARPRAASDRAVDRPARIVARLGRALKWRIIVMTPKDVIRQVVEFCHQVTRTYVDDLTDNELLVRPVPGANHIAWQLGHLISSDHHMLTQLGRPAPALPAGFAERYTKETAASDTPAKFHTKAQYLALGDQMRQAALAAIDATPEADLSQPGPEAMRAYAPTVTSILTMLGTHRLMHAGQFVTVRRKLGKPPLF